MLSKRLLIAFFILYNHFHLVTSTCAGSIEFTSFTSNSNVEIICRDPFILQERHLCHYNGSATSNISDQPITTFTITEDREGLYSCCCSSNCTECHTATIPILAGPLESSAPLILVHEWGEYFQVQCPYVPGPLVDSYTLAWSFDNLFAVVTLFGSNYFTAINNTLNGKSFNPLDIGNYTCEVSTNTTSEIGIVQVSLAEDNTIISNITTGPSSIVLSKPNNDSIDFHCTASVPSFKLIGFSINQTDGSEQFEIIPNRNICWYERSSPSILKCEKSDALLNCLYDKPYEIYCSLILEGFQTQSSYVSCFIAELDGLRLASNATVFQSAGLFTIPDMNCSKAVYNSSTNTVVQPFPYPITVLPVTVEFFNSNDDDPLAFAITKQGELDDTKTVVAFTIPDGFNSYRILFKKMAAGSCGVPSFPSIITSFSAPSAPPIPTMTTICTSLAAEPLLPENETTIIVTSVVASVLLLIISIVSIISLMLIVTSRLKRTGAYQITYNAMASESPVEPNYFEYPSCSDSCSQPSNLDTFIERSYSNHSHSTNSCRSTEHLHNKPLPRYGIPDHHPQQYQLRPTSLHYHTNPPEISVITPTPTCTMDQPVLGGEQYISDCISPTGTEPFSSPITQSRPSDLPIGPSAKTPESAAATPLSDQTMIGVLLYLQHKECNKADNCQTCKLIDRHFVRIANKYGQNALTGMMKNLNTPGAEGTLKHLRKKKIQRETRSPNQPQQAPSLSVAGYRRWQRSHSASHLDEEELVFSDTDDEADELKPSNRRIKPIRERKAVDTLKSSNRRIEPTRESKAVAIHERETYFNQKSLYLQRIEILFLSCNADDGWPHPSHVVLPSSFTKGSENDSNDGIALPIDSQFDNFKPSTGHGLFMRIPEELLPAAKQDIISTIASYSESLISSSGYETDSVFGAQSSLTDEKDSCDELTQKQYSVRENSGAY